MRDESHSNETRMLKMKSDETWDVVVIGAGPAGCATAAILAEQGHRVVILEKEKFPRYKIGESLIPHCWFPLDRLGLVDELNKSAHVVQKMSVQFVSVEGERFKPFYFTEHTDHDSSKTWQVVRSEFDQMMIDNATSKGAVLMEQTAARDLIWEDDRVVGVAVEGPEGRVTLRSRVTVDASGRDTFAQARNSWRKADPKLKKMALWTYIEGAKRDEGIDEGATTIAYVPEKGWFWYIPLANNRVSVGVVAEREYLFRDIKDPDAIFEREVEGQPWIRDHVAPGRKIAKVRVTGDYSYRSEYGAADGLVLVGDAFAFLDPVFSSGVYLALQSGVLAADVIHEALEDGDVQASRFMGYSEDLCHRIESMRRLVYAFYAPNFSFKDLLQKHPHLREDLTACLVGDLSKNFDELFDAVAEFVDVPEKLPHGRPIPKVDPSTTQRAS